MLNKSIKTKLWYSKIILTKHVNVLDFLGCVSRHQYKPIRCNRISPSRAAHVKQHCLFKRSVSTSTVLSLPLTRIVLLEDRVLSSTVTRTRSRHHGKGKSLTFLSAPLSVLPLPPPLSLSLSLSFAPSLNKPSPKKCRRT